jgi:hypothetical protein
MHKISLIRPGVLSISALCCSAAKQHPHNYKDLINEMIGWGALNGLAALAVRSGYPDVL